MNTRKRIPELSSIEFTGPKDITTYSKEGRALCREMAWEFEMSADDIQAALTHAGKGHPALLGLDVRLKARRVSNRLRRAGELQAGVGVELVKFHQQFRRDFAEVLQPEKRRKPKFDFGGE